MNSDKTTCMRNENTTRTGYMVIGYMDKLAKCSMLVACGPICWFLHNKIVRITGQLLLHVQFRLDKGVDHMYCTSDLHCVARTTDRPTCTTLTMVSLSTTAESRFRLATHSTIRSIHSSASDDSSGFRRPSRCRAASTRNLHGGIITFLLTFWHFDSNIVNDAFSFVNQ